MLETPFGKLKVDVYCEKEERLEEKLAININIEKVEPHFNVSDRYRLDVFIAGIQSISHEVFVTCTFEPTIKITKAYAESEEDFEMNCWLHHKLKMSIGIEDGERLAERARCGDEVKQRFAPYCEREKTPYYLQNGMGISLPNVKKDEKIRLIFGVAWLEMEDVEKEEVCTWFAADPNTI